MGVAAEDHAKVELTVLGRKIGVYYGWDQVDDSEIVFYEFEPTYELIEKLPAGDLGFEYLMGEFKTYDDEGGITWKGDAVEILKDFPKVSPAKG